MERTDGYIVHEGCDHIFFVGFLGAGKSTLARNLGRLFRRQYVDTDRLAERIACKSVCEIFDQDGESAFRVAEVEALQRLRNKKSLLVSTGGGIVEHEESCRLMHEMGVVVFLDGDVEDSLRQIQHPEKRPDLGSPEEARELWEHRRPLYEHEADYTIDIRGKTFEQVAAEAGQLLWEKGLL
ncbi:MAG: shikimate kinase [Coriobacteriales bacterium]|nr:shikimate kinase [Coriobacteriales bacterium]